MKQPCLKPLIEQNHSEIQKLLRKKCKKFLNLDWIRYQLRTETECLFTIPYDEPNKPGKDLWLDYTNIKNIEQTYDFISSPAAKDIKINHLEIIDIHRRMKKNTKIAEMVGVYRQSNGRYLKGTDITVPDYNNIEDVVDQIAFRLTNETSGKNVLIRAFDFHFELFAAQPFDDFNKRTARMVMNWFLLQNHCEPILFNYISDRKDYPLALVARAHNDRRTYHEYMYKCLCRTQSDIIKILKNHIMVQ